VRRCEFDAEAERQALDRAKADYFRREAAERARYRAAEMIERQARKNAWLAQPAFFALAVCASALLQCAGLGNCALASAPFIVVLGLLAIMALPDGRISPAKSGLRAAEVDCPEIPIEQDNVIGFRGIPFDRHRFYCTPFSLCIGFLVPSAFS
jgi:hypothetical protein